MSGGFLSELKRRNVIRMAGLYLVGAWLLTQVAGTVLPMFGAPEWLPRSVVILLALGFLPALIFAWVFELTPAGIKRDAEVKPEESIAPQTARRLDRMIIVVLLLALGYFAVDKFLLMPGRAAGAEKGSESFSGKAAHPRSDANRPENDSDPFSPVSAKSVAVLPFVNMSGDPKNEFFSDGITEEILNALAQIADLKVAARTSAFAFKGKDLDLRKIGEILAVATVLEGSIQRAGDDVRITAQLIDARNGYHLWSETFDRKLTNVFAIEDEISRAIATRLQSQLGSKVAGDLGRTTNPQAYEQYLRGLTLLAARGPGLRDALTAFGEAVKLDPGYAEAWGALAETQIVAPGYVPGITMDDALQLAQAAAERALAIAPRTASAHVALGEIREYRRQWSQAEQSFKSALALAPGDGEAVNQYAQFLSITGQNEAALVQIDHAIQLDPLSPIIGVIRAVILMGLHRDDEASAQLESSIAAHPEFGNARWVAMIHYEGIGRFDEAEAQIRVVAKLAGADPEDFARLALGMSDPTQRPAALKQIRAYIASKRADDEPLSDAIVLALLHERDGALERIETFVDHPGSAEGGLLWSRSLDSLREEPRFHAALKKMALPYKSEGEVAQ